MGEPASPIEPVISVLLVTFNHAPFIAQAIESVLAQHVSVPFEVVVGDDCSTDGTREIVQEFEKRHPQIIRLIPQETNRGLAGNRMFLATLRACRGKYVAFLDGDDYWTRADKLQTQLDLLAQHPEYSMCFHDVWVFDQDGAWPPYRFNSGEPPSVMTTEDLLGGNVIQTCSAMVRRSSFDHVPDWLESVEPQDWALYVLASLQGDLAFIDEDMGAYRRHGGGIWHGRSELFHLEKAIGFYETLLRNAVVPGAEPRIRSELAQRHLDSSSLCERAGDYGRAAEHLERCLELKPERVEADEGEAGASGADVSVVLQQRLDRCRRGAGPPSSEAGSALLQSSPFWALGLTRPGWVAFRLAGLLPGVRAGRLWIEEQTPPAGADQVAATLAWVTTCHGRVTVRVGAPSGPVVSQGVSGRTTTGRWVRERTVFFLQDESAGRTLTPANTLAVLRVGDWMAGRAAPPGASAPYPPPPSAVDTGDRRAKVV